MTYRHIYCNTVMDYDRLKREIDIKEKNEAKKWREKDKDGENVKECTGRYM